MKSNSSKPWNDRWDKVEKLSGGGQGTTSLVHARGTGSDELFVLKVLKNQKVPARRLRMYSEAGSLQNLAHPGIPRLIESNTELFKDLSVKLYLVTEYIEGPTLREFSDGKPIELADAFRILTRLAEILQYAHENDVVHRDVKLENIVLRNKSTDDPVLLDFGLSFNSTDNDAQTTDPGEQLGNRSLALPELQAHSPFKRDPRSDVTQCCGVLFELLLGVPPVVLLDVDGMKPHQRKPAATELRKLPEADRSWLATFFDQAFSLHPDRRIQSASQLLLMLAQRNLDQTEDAAVVAKLASVRVSLNAQSDLSSRAHVHQLLVQINQVFRDAVCSVRNQLGDGWLVSQTGHEVNAAQNHYRNQYGIHSQMYPNRQFWGRLDAHVDGQELIVSGNIGKEPFELMRAPLHGPKEWPQLRSRIEALFADGIDALFAG